MKTQAQILKDLQAKHKREVAQLENELKHKALFSKYDIERVYVHDKGKKEKQLISLDIKSLDTLKQLLSDFKPIQLYYIDNTFASDLSKWLKQSVTMQDDTVLNGVEYHKIKNKFFECGLNIGLDFNNNRHEDTIKIEWHTQEYNFWVKIPLNLLSNDNIRGIEQIDTYETENARKYNYRAKEITKYNKYLSGLHKIGFYGGMKRQFATNKKEEQVLKLFLGGINGN